MAFVDKLKKVHFVGIGGVGMSSLAAHLLHLGVDVCGSDNSLDGCKHLLDKGAKVFLGHRASNLDADAQLVVYSQAVSHDNVEIAKALSLGIPIVSREQLLGEIFNGFERRIAVCGTHGKTTTTAMIDYLLRALEVEHTAFIGGFASDTNSNYTFGGGIVVAEACEYKNSFFSLFPTLTVALNVEYDHPDFFASINAVHQSFERFFAKLPPKGLLLANASLPALLLRGKNYVTFGAKDSYYRAEKVVATNDGFDFDFCKGAKRHSTAIGVKGSHNVANAVASLAALDCLGVDVALACKSLPSFAGVGRRYKEHLTNGVTIVEDYAHHPTEIASAIATAKQHKTSGRLLVVFQPHTYTRTKFLWKQFANCFVGADTLAMLPVFAARENPIDGVTSEALLCDVVGVDDKVALDSLSAGVDFVKRRATAGDVVLVLGAGDVNKICKMMQS